MNTGFTVVNYKLLNVSVLTVTELQRVTEFFKNSVNRSALEQQGIEQKGYRVTEFLPFKGNAIKVFFFRALKKKLYLQIV